MKDRIVRPAWETCWRDPKQRAALRKAHREWQRLCGRWYRACRLAGIETAMDVFGRVRKTR